MRRIGACAGLLTAAAWVALAQGPPAMPTPETIANADSYQPPKLTEYAVKLAQQPDMSGLWTIIQPPDAGAGPVFDPVNAFWPPQPAPGEARFGPMPGTYLKNIPYTPEYQKKYRDFIEETKQGKSRDRFAACEPFGMPRMLAATPVPFDIAQSPDVMFWYNDYGRTERRIFLDGRQHPTEPTPTGGVGPSYSGHSVGHWDGNTLAVETVGMFAGWFDETPAPYSDKLSLQERIRLIDTNVLEDRMTFSDPVAFEKLWVVTRYYQRSGRGAAGDGGTGQRMVRAYLNLDDRPCIPNVKIDDNGFQVAVLPQELEAQKAGKSGAKKPKVKKQ